MPIHADARWTIGFSQRPPALPIKCLKEMAVNETKKMKAKTSEIAKNAGAMVGGGATTELGVFEENTEVL